MHIPEQQEVLAFIFIFQKFVFLWPPSHKWHHKPTKIMFQITEFTLSDRIYPIEYTNIRIEDILWPRQILRVVKVRAIWWGKQPCSFTSPKKILEASGVGLVSFREDLYLVSPAVIPKQSISLISTSIYHAVCQISKSVTLIDNNTKCINLTLFANYLQLHCMIYIKCLFSITGNKFIANHLFWNWR